MFFGKDVNVLLYNGTVKKIKDLNNNDLLLAPNGNIIKIKNISKTKTQLFKINLYNGLSIICNDVRFLLLDRKSCKFPSKELKKAKIIEGFVEEGSYVLFKNIKKHNNFNITKELAFILGLFAANGRFLYKNKKITAITLFSENKLEIKELLKDLFPCASIIDNKKLIVMSGKEVVTFFKNHIGIKQKNRKVSLEVFWMNKELQLEFLKGWFSNKSIKKSNYLIGSLRSENLANTIAFMLVRNEIPYSILNNINYRFEISHALLNTIHRGFKKEETNIKARKEYRNFNGNILFEVKNIEDIGIQEAYDLDVNGLIANGYSIGSSRDNIKIKTKCYKCNKKLILFENNICIDCQVELINKISWRYELKCKYCNKLIKSKKGTKKFCSDNCRKASYLKNINYQNFALNHKGYVNKGYLSFPQNFILEFVKNKYIEYNWTFNDRTILKNPITNYPLELDIFCNDLNFAIEYDSKKHFEDEYTQKLDQIKNEECKKNNIKLLRITYKENWKNENFLIERIEEILKNEKNL